ncbi:hypothetical protein ACFU8W_48570 [Streptomyces sp. NPDC057565]|uniref:hypothetical protein n=1 Tax=Streptomyces sp. NPDC057565 TaxID=3346169 RepID=UPI0036AF997E
MTGWLTRHPATLTEEDRAGLKEVLARCPELDKAAGHVRDFGEILTDRLGATLPTWIDAVDASQLPGLTGFARHLLRVLDAVTAGLTLDWSSGSIEGAVKLTLPSRLSLCQRDDRPAAKRRWPEQLPKLLRESAPWPVVRHEPLRMPFIGPIYRLPIPASSFPNGIYPAFSVLCLDGGASQCINTSDESRLAVASGQSWPHPVSFRTRVRPRGLVHCLPSTGDRITLTPDWSVS